MTGADAAPEPSFPLDDEESPLSEHEELLLFHALGEQITKHRADGNKTRADEYAQLVETLADLLH